MLGGQGKQKQAALVAAGEVPNRALSSAANQSGFGWSMSSYCCLACCAALFMLQG